MNLRENWQLWWQIIGMWVIAWDRLLTGQGLSNFLAWMDCVESVTRWFVLQTEIFKIKNKQITW